MLKAMSYTPWHYWKLIGPFRGGAQGGLFMSGRGSSKGRIISRTLLFLFIVKRK